MTAEKQAAVAAIEKKADLVAQVADEIWSFAELSLQEEQSADLYCRVLEQEGFKVERGICNIPTAFSASYGSGRPIIGLLAVAYVADLATASVPMLVLVQNGVGAGVLTPIISILIILGSISTALNSIVTRCVNAVERGRKNDAERMKGHLARNAVFTLIFTFIAFAIAQFGLMAVIKQGYAYLGYAALITLFIPFVLHALITRGREI